MSAFDNETCSIRSEKKLTITTPQKVFVKSDWFVAIFWSMRLIGPCAHLLVRAFWSKFRCIFVIDAAKRWRTFETDVIVHCCHIFNIGNKYDVYRLESEALWYLMFRLQKPEWWSYHCLYLHMSFATVYFLCLRQPRYHLKRCCISLLKLIILVEFDTLNVCHIDEKSLHNEWP